LLQAKKWGRAQVYDNDFAPNPLVLDMGLVRAFMIGEGWTVGIQDPEKLDIQRAGQPGVFIRVTRLILAACNFSEATSGPMRNDLRKAVRAQGLCL